MNSRRNKNKIPKNNNESLENNNELPKTKFQKFLSIIVIYIGIAASIATIYQVVSDICNPEGTNTTATNNTGNTTITQIQIEDGNIYCNNPENTYNAPQNNTEISSSQFVPHSYDLIQDGKYELAVAEIQHFIDEGNLDPMNISILNYNLGVAYYNLGQYGMAKTVLNTAVNTAGFAEAYYFLGVINGSSLDNYPEAIQAFTKALEYESKPEYLLARAWAYEKNNQLQDACNDYYEVLSIDPQNEQAIIEIERIKGIGNEY